MCAHTRRKRRIRKRKLNMSRMAEQYQEQIEQDNLSGMDLCEQWHYEQSKLNTKELQHEHISVNTGRIRHGQDNQLAQHGRSNNAANSVHQKASSVPF